MIHVPSPGKACLDSRWTLSQFPVKPASNPGRFVSRFPVGGCFESRWKPVSDPGVREVFKNEMSPPLVHEEASMLASQPVSMPARMLERKQTHQHANRQESQPADQSANKPSCGLASRHAIQEAG